MQYRIRPLEWKRMDTPADEPELQMAMGGILFAYAVWRFGGKYIARWEFNSIGEEGYDTHQEAREACEKHHRDILLEFLEEANVVQN